MTKIGEDTNVTLDLKTIGIIVGGAISLASMYFALKSDIAVAKELPKPEVSKIEWSYKDELVRSEISNTNETVEGLDNYKDYNIETLYMSKAPKRFKEIKYLPTIVLYNDGEEELRIESGITLKLPENWKEELNKHIEKLLSQRF